MDRDSRCGADSSGVVAHAYTLGLLRRNRIRRIARLAGLDIRAGLPARGGQVAIWGAGPRSWRGRAVARWRRAGVVHLEDAFLRSVRTGRQGSAPLGLVIDRKGLYFDCSAPSELEDMLNGADLSDAALLQRAESGIRRLKGAHISKYNAFDPALAPPFDDYVLVVDQTRNDASIRLGGANGDSFRRMLAAARAENPGKPILVKTHPEVAARHRAGYLQGDAITGADGAETCVIDRPLSPWRLLSGASRVYCVTSLMGFEAILAGHRPRVFGRPFYAGWGLSDDEQVIERRERRLKPAQLFAAAMLLYPCWYDPYRDRLCDFETVVDILEARARAWREDHRGYDAHEIRLWKRPHLRRFLRDAGRGLRFRRQPRPGHRPALIWAGKTSAEKEHALGAPARPVLRLEDGFLRSRGLGAELVPPLSLVLDDLGIYFDPARESRLERLLNGAESLPDDAIRRARRLRQKLVRARISKYNLPASMSHADGHDDGRRRILVPAQVEDDASIRLGAGRIRRNIDLLRETRQRNPDAIILYKPHPDVQAGLRPGAVSAEMLAGLADEIIDDPDPTAAIDRVDEVWTITSTLGFEALLRGRQVVCLGVPFYAGWGLTRDLTPPPARRKARLSLDAMVWAALIAYPRYFDPVTSRACPVEVAVDRLAQGAGLSSGPVNHALSKLQGMFASWAPLWR